MAESAPERPERTISRGMVGIYKQNLGRGPVRSKTTITDAFSATVLEQSLTTAEKRLAGAGDYETVQAVRLKLQSVLAEEMIQLVEDVCGRRAKCLLSDHDVATDTAIEVIVFADAGPASEQADDTP